MFILVSDFDMFLGYVNVYRKWGFQLKQKVQYKPKGGFILCLGNISFLVSDLLAYVHRRLS